MHFDYLTALVFASVGFVFVFANLAIGSILRPRRKSPQGLEVYECGEETIGETWVKFDIRYYTVALVYVIFAVEIAFLFPWAIVLVDALRDRGLASGSGIGIFALVEGVIFIGVLFLGLAYVWAKGDLDWVMHFERKEWRAPEPRRPPVPPPIEDLEKDALEAEGHPEKEPETVEVS